MGASGASTISPAHDVSPLVSDGVSVDDSAGAVVIVPDIVVIPPVVSSGPVVDTAVAVKPSSRGSAVHAAAPIAERMEARQRFESQVTNT